MITLADIRQAEKAIRENIVRTPLVHSPTLSRMFGGDVYLKLENLQRTGSFKIRGASHALTTRRDAVPPGGVVAASAGNHAQGVALAARQAGIPATIVMPEWASISKQEATRGYGGEVVLSGQTLGESLEKAQSLAAEGRMFLHPFDDPDIMAGQGTVGLEIMAQLEDADQILVPVGGGGLIAGVATAVKSLRPEVRVIGIEAAACPSASESFRRGKAVRVPARPSIADGIAVKQPGAQTFGVIRKYVDDIALVAEEHIAAAILMLLERKKILAEGAGAVALAALLNGAVPVPPGSKTVLLISGGNVDSPLLGRIIRKGLLKNGRIMRLKLHLEDIPGSLSRLLRLVARLKANVLHIVHDRDVKDLPVHLTYVELELETRSADHIATVKAELHRAGYEPGVECYP